MKNLFEIIGIGLSKTNQNPLKNQEFKQITVQISKIEKAESIRTLLSYFLNLKSANS